MGRQGSVGGPPPQGPVPVLAGLMDGNGCSIGTHILSYKPDVLKSNARAGPAVTRQGSAIPRSLTLSNKKLSEAGALAPASLYKGSARPSH